MDFNTLMQEASKIINGSFSEYDEKTSIIIVPIDDHRFQTVFAHDEDEQGIKFNSKSCDSTGEMPYKELMHENAVLKYARLELENDSLFVTGRALPGSEAASVSSLLSEVGKVADKWELKLTGKDVN